MVQLSDGTTNSAHKIESWERLYPKNSDGSFTMRITTGFQPVIRDRNLARQYGDKPCAVVRDSSLGGTLQPLYGSDCGG